MLFACFVRIERVKQDDGGCVQCDTDGANKMEMFDDGVKKDNDIMLTHNGVLKQSKSFVLSLTKVETTNNQSLLTSSMMLVPAARIRSW